MSASILDDYPERSIRDAIKEYEARTLIPATQAREVDVYAPEGILTELGPVHAITYTGTLQGDTELYEHTFKGDAQPDLMVDAKNTLHLVGGDYHVADVGIVDGEGPMPKRNPVQFAKQGFELTYHEKEEGTPDLSSTLYSSIESLLDALVFLASSKRSPGYLKTYIRPVNFINEWVTGVLGNAVRLDLTSDADWKHIRAVLEQVQESGARAAKRLEETQGSTYYDGPEENPSHHNFEWPPHHLPILAALAFQSSQAGTRETPRLYDAISLYDFDQRPGMKEDHEDHLLELYQREPAQFEVALGAYLGRKYRFLWDAEYRSNPVNSDYYRQREQAASTDAERHHWRRMKGQARHSNPVVTNRVSPSSPVENAGVLAMAMPGGSPYGLPQVNAGALAAAPNYPGNYDFPGVTNGSHGLLGPQIRRNVPGQPIANPVSPTDPQFRPAARLLTSGKQDGRWHRQDNKHYGSLHYLHAGEIMTEIIPYKPRKHPDVLQFVEDYNPNDRERWKGPKKVPKNTKYLTLVSDFFGARGSLSNQGYIGWTAHKTLAAAKRSAEKAMRATRDDEGYQRGNIPKGTDPGA